MKKRAPRHGYSFARGRGLLLAVPAAGLAAAPAAVADIIYTNLSSSPINVPSPTGAIYFDLVTQTAQTTDFSGRQFFLYFYSTSPVAVGNGATGVAGYGAFVLYAYKFNSGSLIDGGSDFYSYGYLDSTGIGQWSSGDRGYLGLFLPGNFYGWADVEYGTDHSLTLYGFAYENDGTGILTGAVPEPAETGALAALAAGSAAAFAARRRRAARR